MIVITAGTAGFLPIICAQARECERYGYKHIIYDLGGLGMGVKHKVPEKDLLPALKGTQPPTKFKLDLLPTASRETVCWLDGDCLPRAPFEPPGEWDVAVTLRPDGEIIKKRDPASRFLNAGIVWIKHKAGQFLDEWRALLPKRRSDQDALNLVVGRNFTANNWIKSRGKIVLTSSSLAVLILDAMEWNCWYFPPPQHARILHFKADRRHLIPNYL